MVSKGILAIITVIVLVISCISFHYTIVKADSQSYGCDEPVRIMPIGDSQTLGTPFDDGYRGYLYNNLTEKRHYVDFVGSTGSGEGFDSDHEGHYGWTANQIRDSLNGWLELNPPDIIILLIGGADYFWSKADPSDTCLEVVEILDIIDQFEEDNNVHIKMILTTYPQEKLFSRAGFSTYHVEYHDMLEAMASERINNGDDIVFVNMDIGLTLQDMSGDGSHLGRSGNQKMAVVLFDVLHGILPECETVQQTPTTTEPPTETPTAIPTETPTSTPSPTQQVTQITGIDMNTIGIIVVIIIIMAAAAFFITKRKKS